MDIMFQQALNNGYNISVGNLEYPTTRNPPRTSYSTDFVELEVEVNVHAVSIKSYLTQFTRENKPLDFQRFQTDTTLA